MGYQGSLIIVAGIEAVQRDGIWHYLLPAHRNSQRHDRYGDRRQFVLESTSLVHWKFADYVEMPASGDIFLHEGCIDQGDRPGELKMVMRTADMERERPLDPPLAFSSVSRDGGRTWSAAVAEPDLPNYRAKSYYGQDSTGRKIYVYNDSGDRHGLYYKTKRGGESWSAERTFYFDKDRNSYPTLLEDKPGAWIAVWDSSDTPDRKRTAIRFGRLRPE